MQLIEASFIKSITIPAPVPSDNPNDVVQGEVYLIHQADIVLPLLDQYEECGPEFPEPNEYSRQKQSVLLKDGRHSYSMGLCLQPSHGRPGTDQSQQILFSHCYDHHYPTRNHR